MDIELRDSIVSSGQDIHRPMNVARRMSEFNSDKDVNRSLMTMLLSPTEAVSSHYSHFGIAIM